MNDASQSVTQGMAIAKELDLGWMQLFGFSTEAQIMIRQNSSERGSIMQTLGRAIKILTRSRSWTYLLHHSLARADVYLVMGERLRAAKEISRARRIYIKMEIPEGTPESHALESRLGELLLEIS